MINSILLTQRFPKMQLSALFIAFAYCFVTAYTSICNKNPYDVEACIHNSTIQCYWSVLTDSCQKANGFDYGCDNSLSQLLCVKQLYSFGNTSQLKLCYFGQRCQDASSQQLNMLNCSLNLSKYACVSITTPGVQCKWNDGQCLNIKNQTSLKKQVDSVKRCENNSKIVDQFNQANDQIDDLQIDEIYSQTDSQGSNVGTQLCQDTYNQSVNSNVCANLVIKQACQHGGQIDEYRCIVVSDMNLSLINCNTEGLNRYGCLSINTPGQNCVFQNGLCSLITSTNQQSLSCNSQINRLACLGFMNLSQTCQWNSTSNQCQNITNVIPPCQNLTLSQNIKDLNVTNQNTTDQNLRNLTNLNVTNQNLTNQNLTKQNLTNQNTTNLNVTNQNLTNQNLTKQNLTNQNTTNLNVTNQNLTNQNLTKQNLTNQNTTNLNVTSQNLTNQNLTKQNLTNQNTTDQNLRNLTNQNITNQNLTNLGITNVTQLNLNSNFCQNITNFALPCQNLTNVSISTCASSTNQCTFNTTSGGCRQTNPNQDSCSSIGISQLGCLSLNQTCRYDTKCQQMSLQDLNTYRCSSNLTKLSCLNLQTPGQLCQWSAVGQKCQNINLAPESSCTTFLNVNGNVCQAILKDGCKYNFTDSTCIISLTGDICSASFLNIVGCVHVKHKGSTCEWIENQQQCQDITVISGITKCNDLRNVNAAACSQVYRPELNLDERNCRYHDTSRGCVTYPALDENADCNDSGINQYGCVSVVKPNQWCRWQNSNCTTISTQVEVQSINCLNLQQVNAAVCSLALAGGERCKYEPISNNCITTVDIYVDQCSTVGLNSYGCEAIKSQQCFFDLMLLECRSTELLSNDSQKSYFSSFTCQGNFLTQFNCLAVQTLNQQCHWDLKQSLCLNIELTHKDQCLDVTQVNSNTCAAVQVTHVSPQESYCIYNSTNNLCSIAKTGGLPCTTPGLNIYSCSAMTSMNKYCYYEDSQKRCLEFVTLKEAEVSQKWSDLQIDCSKLNSRSCPLNKWSVNQKCLFNSTFRTGLCTNLDFINDANSQLYKCSYFQNPNITVNPYVCAAVTSTKDYCIYDITNQRCQPVLTKQVCVAQYLNIKSCLFKTLSFCEWDLDLLKCLAISPGSQTSKACTDLVNQNTCTSIDTDICQFNETLSLCQVFTPVTNLTMCSDLATQGMTYNQLACQEITKPGQFCEYNPVSRVCQTQIMISLLCRHKGSNQGSCFARTPPQIGCYWNQANKLCQDIADISDENAKLTVPCSYGINKYACLNLISTHACQWDITLGQCTSIIINNQTGCADLNSTLFLQNSFSCQKITKIGQNCYYDAKNNICNNFTQTSLKTCTNYVRNINSCLQLTTQAQLYCAWDPITLTCSPILNANLNQIKCSDPVNKNICLDTASGSCKWDTITNQCSNYSTFNIQCSSLTKGTNLFNRMACVQQSYNGTILNPSLLDQTKCSNKGIQSDYCSYNSATNMCAQIFLQTYSDISASCDYNYLNTCDRKLNYLACVKLTIPECYFTDECSISVNQYNVMTCSQANQMACPLITTPQQLCTYNTNYEICEVYPGTQFKPNNTCQVGDNNNVVNSNVCANIVNGHCTWDQSNQVCINASSKVTYLCSDPGINQGTCNDYTNNICTFNQVNLCQGHITYHTTCSEVNNYVGAQTLCSKVTQQSCFYDTTQQLCVQVIDFTLLACTQNNVFNLNACIQITHLLSDGSQNFCVFDRSQTMCIPYTYGTDDPSSTCLFTNKFACLNFTISTKNCVWITDPITSMSSCQEYQSASLKSYTAMSLVGSCRNVSNQACLEVQSDLQCKLVNQNICMDITIIDTKVNSCSNMTQINDVVCSNLTQLNNIKQYCQFQKATPTNTSYCVPSRSNQLCDAKGLNIYSCIGNTWLTVNGSTNGAQCLWNSTITQCLTIYDPTYYLNGICNILNKNACVNNLNVLQPCVWSDSALTCSILLGPLKCSDYKSTLVSTYVCSEASDVACKYDTIGNVCSVMQSTDSPLPQCGVQGINKLGCLTKTPGLTCQWIQNQYLCYSMDESANSCTDELNIFGCININYLGQNCNYNTVTNQCQNFVVNSATSLAQVTDSKFKYNKQTCSSITIAGAYTAYDSVNQICFSLTSSIYQCTQPGINKWGCLSMTNQPCSFTLSTGCQTVSQSALKNLQCDHSYNIITCQQLAGSGCKFMNGICSQVSLSDKCSDLSTGVTTNIQACAGVNDPLDFCQYDPNNLRCMQMTKVQNQCEIVGINQKGCLNHTTSYCRFEKTDFSCITESNFDQYQCSDLVNQLNCLSITTNDQVCQYDQQCSDFLIDNSTDCPTSIQVNAQTCVKIQKPLETCIYNSNTNRCQNITHQTKCTDPFINKVGCLQIKTRNKKCQWDGDDENSICYDFDNPMQDCSSPINQAACLSIDPDNYNCIWSDGSCNTITGSPNCASLLLINSPQACQVANDPCRYNMTSKSCNVITHQDPKYLCDEIGLSKSACKSNTMDKTSCIFDKYCYLPSEFLICSQAQSSTECMTVVAACQWINDQCTPFTQTNSVCDNSLPQLITKRVCQIATTINVQNTCSYIATYQTINNKINILKSYCFEKKPLTCFASEDQRSCIHIVGQPCIWDIKTMKCSLIIMSQFPGIYTCAMLGNLASQRTCSDLIRIGEYCTYNQNQCLRVDPHAATTTCNSTINFEACIQINSGNQTCIWNVVNISNIIQDKITLNNVISYPYITYQQGTCQILTNFQITNCSSNLNIYSCLAVTTPGQYCQWLGYQCASVQLSNVLNPPPIEKQQYTQVNSNVCTLVNLDGQSVKYDAQINGCVQSDYKNDQCLTPGLNKAGCLNISSYGCKWNLITKTCVQYEPISSSIKSCSMVDKNVNSFVCSQITSVGVKCTYIKNMCVDTYPKAQCDGQGLNKAGCLSLTTDSCVWQNNQCFKNTIVPDITSCDGIPFPTNAYSCQQVTYFTQLCKYDPINLKCVSFTGITQETCLTVGLNLLACSFVTQGYCQFVNGQCNNFTNKGQSCRSVGNGNPGSCSLTKQPVDKCKYDFLNLACGPSGYYDVCSTPGINSEGCNLLKSCQWQDTKKICQCIQAQNLLPLCSSINIAFNCKARKDCFFTTQENNDATFQNLKFNYTVAQQLDLYGTCKNLTCSDMKFQVNNTNSTFNESDILCKGNSDPFGRQCLASSTQKLCRSVSSCEEIVISELGLYTGCSSFYFGNRPCQNITQNKNCSSFSCSSYLTSADCNQKYCVFTIPNCNTNISQCLDIQCEDLSVNNCFGIINYRSCFFNNNTCHGISTCDQINLIKTDIVKKEQTCNSAREDSKQCGWVQTNISLTSNQCSSISCRYVGYNQETCSGIHVLGDVCVMVKPNCVSCEEIIDQCTCLSNSPYCAYDAFKSKCQSVPCSSYTKKRQCLNVSLNGMLMCQYKNKQCLPQCSRMFSKTTCNSNNGCLWSDMSKSCQILPIIPVKIKLQIPQAVNGQLQIYTMIFEFLVFIMLLC